VSKWKWNRKSRHSCASACWLVQGQEPPLCRRRSPVHGWGMYAVGPIPANVFVIEYIGELLRRPLDDVREKVGLGFSVVTRG
jgi:SET domain-containing protein